MHRPLIRASMVTLLFALVWSSLLPVSAAPPTTIPNPETIVSNPATDSPIASDTKATHHHNTVETVSTINGFDGSFSTPSSQTGFLSGPVSVEGSGIVTTTMIVPTGFIRDSLRVDVSITADKIHNVWAELELRALGQTEWSRYVRVLVNPGTEPGGPPVTTTVTQKHVTLGNRVPLDTPMEMLLRCWISNIGSFDYTWSNFTFFLRTLLEHSKQ
ncbi:MAG: hypothetical protein GFH27_549281n53 [Chloroflexi bacterium AL-W]|nr:hypothetical protein [Chloroflexi bacterium AL-N1]NOK65939.1 hypothetical protein [Chloroflexi bacterium AL-N10]NOK72820.1 hypothetical protein [Chloroflexi bacterium AL-N5]NOK79717.1 hypothetical protein [Chloroflexi bacterium AL-W]NOK88427.1 hypothetical protein [Chloroflexi bacterium AL-N15]